MRVPKYYVKNKFWETSIRMITLNPNHDQLPALILNTVNFD